MNQYFHISFQWQIAICKQCQHAVWFQHVANHLRKQHQLSRKEVAKIKCEIQTKAIIQNSAQFEQIQQIEKSISELKMYYDEWTCTAESFCYYIVLKINTIKNHCAKQHSERRSRSTYKTRNTQNKTWASIRCQQMFNQWHVSNFFRIESIRTTAKNIQSNDVIAKAKRQIREIQQAMTQKSIQEIQDRQEDIEFSSWLNIMKWRSYLKILNRQALMNLVKIFDANQESLIFIVWNVMNSMLRHSQQTIKKQTKYYLRMKMMRNETQQIKCRSLQSYMHLDVVKNYTRSWKQMIALFVRMRHDEKKKFKYRFETFEQECFDNMIKQVRRLRNRRIQHKSHHRSNNNNSDNDNDRSSIITNIDNNSDDDVSNQVTILRLRELKAACLRFCLTLLKRQCRDKDYELLMLCAMAILTVKVQEWRNVHEYPFIMSQIIKMARFMIIQTTFQLIEKEFVTESKKESNMLKSIVRFVDQCMIRDSHCAMQWILDRRAYEMKIHYISTILGNIDWMKNQIRYKQIEFSMSQLRNLIHELMFKAYRALKKMMYNSKTKFSRISWKKLRDDFTRENIDHNFVEDDRNLWSMNERTWLNDRLLNFKILRHRHETISKVKCESWYELIDHFHELLITLMQWVWRQNVRELEFLSMCEWSSEKNQERNMFLADEYDCNVFEKCQIELIIRYHKGYNISDQKKVIHRFLSQEMNALLIWNAWLIRSTWNALQHINSDEKFCRQWNIWHIDARGRSWAFTRMSREMKRISEKELGEELTLQS